MAASDKVGFVMTPGSFATPILYEDNLAAGLRNKGFSVNVLGLPSVSDGSRMPPATMEQDAEHIREALLQILDDPQQPKDAVLMTHSYSGIPGSSSLKGLSKADRAAQKGAGATGVVGIVYLASFVPLEGQSIRDIMGEAMPEPYRVNQPGTYLPAVDPALAPFVFNDLPPERAVEIMGKMALHSSDSYSGKAFYEPWKHNINARQIIPTQDLIVPTAMQEEMNRKATEAGGQISKIMVEGASHALNVSQTDRVVSELVKAAEESLAAYA